MLVPPETVPATRRSLEHHMSPIEILSVKVRPPVRERWLTQARQGFPPPHLPSSSVLVRPSSAGVAEPATGTAVKCGNHAWDRPEAEALTWMLEASSVVASAVTVIGVGLAQASSQWPATPPMGKDPNNK